MPLLESSFLQKLDRLVLRTRKRRSGVRGGEKRSNRRGQSQEFADHRPYVPGDDLRFLDWHLYGRLDTLWIKLFEEESDRTVQIVLDRSGSMDGEKLDYARKVAAAFSWIALGRSDRVAVGSFDDALRDYAPPRRGRRNAHGVFRTLEEAHPGGETDPDRAFAAWPQHRGGGVILLFTDFLYPDGYEKPLRRLASRGDELHVFHVMSPAEIKPPIEGDLTLVDRETGETLQVTVTPELKERYTKRILEWSDEIQGSCRSMGATYSRLLTHVPLEDLMLQDMRRGGVLG
ncbi:MAG: DUF58 domain-containing protein [Myxococcota bacterium]